MHFCKLLQSVLLLLNIRIQTNTSGQTLHFVSLLNAMQRVHYVLIESIKVA